VKEGQEVCSKCLETGKKPEPTGERRRKRRDHESRSTDLPMWREEAEGRKALADMSKASGSYN
jgi:hypothetical protein